MLRKAGMYARNGDHVVVRAYVMGGIVMKTLRTSASGSSLEDTNGVAFERALMTHEP